MERSYAFTAILEEAPDGRSTISRADEGISGHTPQPHLGTFPSYQAAQAKASELNGTLGLSDKEAARIVLSTFGPPTRNR